MSLIAMPCAVGLAVLSEPIIRLLARNYGPESVATAAPILAYLGIAVIFNSTVLLFNAIMQAHGDVTTPVVNMLIGGVVKVVVNYILVAIPSLNIIGAAIGTIVCYVTITVLDLIAMRRSVTTRPAIFRNVIRPRGAAGIMGAATFFGRCAAAELHGFEYRRLPRRADRGGRCVRDFRRGSAVHHVRGLYAAAEGRKNCKNPAYQTKNMNLPLAKETKV